MAILGTPSQPTRPIRAGRLTLARAPPSVKRFHSIRCARLTRRHPVKIRRKWTPEAPRLEGQGRGRYIMRLPRRAPLLLVAFTLLTSAATAHAECAWELWLRNDSSPWDVLQAFSTREDCIEAMSKQVAAVESSPRVTLDT